ncbi:MAG TPA: helix-turn-helix transcriptional regulator, partial [Haloplasmataceae bacterium]
MFDPIKIAAFINKLRKEKDMTQLELAELLKVTPQAVSKWERGEALPDISLLPELAKIFDVTIDSIINGEIREQNVIDKALNEISIGHLDNVTNLLNSKVLKPNDLVTISPLLKTSVVDKVIAESDENLYTIEDIIALAPFASVDLLYNLLAKFEKLDITQFVKLVPFLNFSTIESAFKKVDYQNITKEQIISLAPFLNLHDFNEIVEKNLDLLKEASTIIKIAPFTNHET